MAGFAGKFESVRQDWSTPQELFNKMDLEFWFTLDAAASAENTKVPGSFITEEQNALVTSWGKHSVWLNPPYGDTTGKIKDWVKRAYEASCEGATVVMLIPARTNTEWFHDYCLDKGEVRFVRGRPKFGDARHGLPQPLCYVIFRPA